MFMSCRICGGPLPPRARTLCSDECRKVAHRERVRKAIAKYEAESGQSWHRRYREKRAAYNRRYYEKHGSARARYPETAQAGDQRRRARKAKATTEAFSLRELYAAWEELELFRCAYCDGPFEHVDHVEPLALGGVHAIGNLVPACADCNVRKGAKPVDEFLREVGWTSARFGARCSSA